MSRDGRRWWKYSGSKPVAVALLAALCVGGLYVDGAALLGTRALRSLDATPIGRYVDVACESIEPAGTFENGQHGYLCKLGSRVLPVVGNRDGDDATSAHLTGRLREFRAADAYGRSDTGDADFVWPSEVVNDPAVANAYLELMTLWRGRIFSALAIVAGIAAIALAVRWRIWRH